MTAGLAIDVLSWICLLGGGLFAAIGGLGLLRMPDLFTRMHAAGITDTLGAGLVLGGLALQVGLTLVSVKLMMILGFLLITSPTSTHALAKAALTRGVPMLSGGSAQGRSSNS